MEKLAVTLLFTEGYNLSKVSSLDYEDLIFIPEHLDQMRFLLLDVVCYSFPKWQPSKLIFQQMMLSKVH